MVYLIPCYFHVLVRLDLSGTGSPIHFDLGVVVEGETPLSAALVSSLNAVDVITLHQGTLDDEQDALAEGDRSAVIVLPKFQGKAVLQYQFTIMQQSRRTTFYPYARRNLKRC